MNAFQHIALTILGLTTALCAAARGVEYSSIDFAGQRFTVCTVQVRKEHLQLFLRDDAGQTIKRFDRLAALLQTRGQRLVFAMNAGMYQPDYSAQGLFVAEGREQAPLNTGSGYGNFFLKPNGVFALTDTGARVLETSEYPKLREHVLLATQSGPLLVRHGKIHPAFKRDSDSRLYRNGVGVPTPDTAVFVISEGPINFYEFATLFRDKLKCPDALFLDGTVCSLYATALKRSDFRIDLGPLIGVSEPAQP